MAKAVESAHDGSVHEARSFVPSDSGQGCDVVEVARTDSIACLSSLRGTADLVGSSPRETEKCLGSFELQGRGRVG